MTDGRGILGRTVAAMENHESNGNGLTRERELPFRAAPRWEGLFPEVDLAQFDLFTDEYGKAYATVPTPEGRRTLRVASDAMRKRLLCLLIERGYRPSQGRIRDLIAALEALASREMRELHNRSAWDRDRSGLYIDLADPAGRAVRVDATGWKVIDRSPVGFRRFVHQRPLPDPDPAGDLRELLDFLIPLGSDRDRLLLLAWTVAALAPMPRPILMLIGEQGSGKTTLSRFIRGLVDPSQCDVLGRDRRGDLHLTFSRYAVPVFDNIDALTPEESDLFCQAATGRAIDRRGLFTDGDEYLLRYQPAIIINGLWPPSSRADLLDRSLIVELERLTPARRRTLDRLESEYEAVRPRLFGGLLNALRRTLELLAAISEEDLIRMADFHRFGRAAASALGFTVEEFDAAIKEAESRQNREASDNSLAAAMRTFALRQRHWEGEAPALLERLIETAKAHQIRRSPKSWPETAIGLGRKIDQLAAALARHGVVITRARRAHERLIRVDYDPAADADRQGEG
jgi:hypothetical protein